MSDPYLPPGCTQGMIDTYYGEEPKFRINNVGEKCQICRLCGDDVSEVDAKLPLEEGVCYRCMWGSTGDPEEFEER